MEKKEKKKIQNHLEVCIVPEIALIWKKCMNCPDKNRLSNQRFESWLKFFILAFKI